MAWYSWSLRNPKIALFVGTLLPPEREYVNLDGLLFPPILGQVEDGLVSNVIISTWKSGNDQFCVFYRHRNLDFDNNIVAEVHSTFQYELHSYLSSMDNQIQEAFMSDQIKSTINPQTVKVNFLILVSNRIDRIFKIPSLSWKISSPNHLCCSFRRCSL